MRHRITNEFDYLVARAERETENARKVLSESRTSNSYWHEKAAAKLLAFCEHHERVLRLYAEAKLYNPEMADTLERHWPYLATLCEQNRDEYREFTGGSQK